jgi:hypothetical protein
MTDKTSEPAGVGGGEVGRRRGTSPRGFASRLRSVADTSVADPRGSNAMKSGVVMTPRTMMMTSVWDVRVS